MEIRVKEESSKKSVPRTAGFQGKVFITPMVTATGKESEISGVFLMIFGMMIL